MKLESRMLGIDDAPFSRSDETVKVIGVFTRGADWIEGIISTNILRDDHNVNEKLLNFIKNNHFFNQLKAIFLGGITIGGFGVIDINFLSKQLNLPVIAVTRNYPDFPKIFRALEKLNFLKELEIIKKTQPPVRVNNVFVQWSGCSFEKMKDLLSLSISHSYFPEPVRIAHLIGSGIVLGESKGRV